MDMELKSLVLNLSRKCTAKNYNLMLNSDEFQNVLRKILKNLHSNEWKKTVFFYKISLKEEELWMPFAGWKGNDQVVLLLAM